MIFVSYSNKDRERVEALVIDLGILGYNVYFEEKSLGGSRRWDEIFENIEQSDAFVYTITANTLPSYSRLLEYEHALALGKPIVAVRFEEVDLWGLPPGVPQIIDYQPQNAVVRAELARALNALLPATQATPSTARPGLSFALAQLSQRINEADTSAAEKAAILLNLQDFLERRETYAAAESMLNTLIALPGSSDALASEAVRTRARLKRTGASRSFLSRGLGLKSPVVLAAIIALFWLIRRSPGSRILGDPASTEDISVRATATLVNVPVEITTEVMVVLPQSTGSSQPSLTASATPQPSATSRFPSSSSMDALAQILPTATRQPPTATHLPSTTPPPPTATRQPPTSTHFPTQAPTATRQPPTATPLPPTATRQPPTATHLPPAHPPPPTQQPPVTHPQGNDHGNGHGNGHGNAQEVANIRANIEDRRGVYAIRRFTYG